MKIIKGKFSILSLLTMIVILFLTSSANAQVETTGIKLKNIRAVSCDQELTMPIWSPDGSKLIVATSHGMELRLIDLENENSIKVLSKTRGAGFNASWSPDGTKVYYRHKTQEHQINPEVKSITLNDQKVADIKLNPNGLLSASKATKASDPIVFINIETLGIEAHTKDESKNWKITQDEGQYYRPLLSPDKSQLIVHQGSNMLLYCTDGGLVKKLGVGIASSWSPDGKYIIAFLDSSSDGHVISNSELYLIDIEAGTTSAITNSTDMHEMWPNWSPDGKHIAFEDERTGRIFIADVVR